MKTYLFLLVALLTIHLSAKEPVVKIIAYINQKSGCQKPTEKLLEDIVAQNKGKVSLEMVDFGSPEGRKRWRGDGMKCMGIRLNGKANAEIWYRGVKLDVTFNMPAGHLWRHDELEAAVRQQIHGVVEADKKAPEVKTETKNGITSLFVAGEKLHSGKNTKDLEQAGTILNKLGTGRPIIQEEFRITEDKDLLILSIRGKKLLECAKPSVTTQQEAQKALAPFLSIMAAFPRIQRPFPPGLGGMTPHRRN